MSELETLQTLNVATGLIRSIPDKDQQLVNVGEFTRRAAWALRASSYGNVLKTSGVNVRGLSADVIMRSTDGAAFDIVVGKQTDNPQVAFNSAGTLDPRALFVAPQPEPSDPRPDPPPAPDPAPPNPDPIDRLAADAVEELRQLVAAAQRQADALSRIADELVMLNGLVVKVKF